jgi:hypothetical protein
MTSVMNAPNNSKAMYIYFILEPAKLSGHPAPRWKMETFFDLSLIKPYSRNTARASLWTSEMGCIIGFGGLTGTQALLHIPSKQIGPWDLRLFL